MLYSEVTGLPEYCFQPPYYPADSDGHYQAEESEFMSLDLPDDLDCETCRESIEMMAFEDFEILPSDEDACCGFGDFPEDWDDVAIEEEVDADVVHEYEYEVEEYISSEGSSADPIINTDEQNLVEPDSSLQRLVDDIIIIGIK
jgi:hypothetical protein